MNPLIKMIIIFTAVAVQACEERIQLDQSQSLNAQMNSRDSELESLKRDESEIERGTVSLHSYDEIQAIWDQKCVSCHSYNGGSPAADLSLEANDSFEALVNVYSFQAYSLPLVAPSDLEASYLWAKLSDQQYDVGGTGDQMPPSYVSDDLLLTSDELNKIQAWITQGALLNFALQIDEPSEPIDEPSEPIDEPSEPIDEPSEPIDEPSEPIDEPSEPIDEPSEPIDEPSEPIDEPSEPIDEPSEPIDEPSEPIDEPSEPTVSYEQIQEIYNGSCTGCHGEPGFFGVSGNLSLATQFSYEATVEVASSQQREGMFLIMPGSPEQSYLWHKINDTHQEVGGSGRGMSPGVFGYNSLPQAELDLIETWILEGARP